MIHGCEWIVEYIESLDGSEKGSDHGYTVDDSEKGSDFGNTEEPTEGKRKRTLPRGILISIASSFFKRESINTPHDRRECGIKN